jgi:hypothetical protein
MMVQPLVARVTVMRRWKNATVDCQSADLRRIVVPGSAL